MRYFSTSAQGLTRRFVLPLVAFGLTAASALGQASFYNMTTANYSQDFADIANWGNSYASGVGANNWRVATTVATSPLTNATVFTTGFSGGVQKGTASMVLLATGTNAGGTDLLLNFSGRVVGNLSFNWAKVVNTANASPRTSDLKIQFSLDNGATFTDVAGYSIPRISNNTTPESGSISVQLPAAITDQAQVVLRFYFWNNGQTGGSGSRPKWQVDDVVVTSTPASADAPVITSPTTASVTAFESSSNIYQITASNSPESFGVTGLPDGLTIDPATGIISGTATVPGVYPVALSATNNEGTGGATLTLTVIKNPGAPTITSELSASGIVGSAFTYSIVADNSPTSYSSGSLPAGLTLDPATGVISGIPTAGGTFAALISAANDLGGDTQTLAITIDSPPVITSALSGSLYVGDAFNYTIGANFSPSSYGAVNLPEGWTIDTVTGAISSVETPLALGTTTFQISATNAQGTTTQSYTLRVFDQAGQDAIPLNVVVNKYLNATPDRIQLLVIGDGTPRSTVDMRGMIIKDFSSSMAGDNGGKFIFADASIWSAVPAGTFIALSGGNTQAEDIDPADFLLAVNLGNDAYFTNGGGSFDIATTEMVLLKTAGSGVSGVAGGIHALAGGTAGSWFNAYTGAKARATATSGTNIGVIALNSTSQIADYGAPGSTSTDAQGGQAAASLNFTTWNNASNENFVQSLRGLVDGTGSAVVRNATAGSPFTGRNVFGRNLSGQTVQVVYTPTSPTTAISAITIGIPEQLGIPLLTNISVAGAGTENALIGVADQVITVSNISISNPDAVTVSVAGLSTPDTSASVTNSGVYALAMQSQGLGGSLVPLAASPAVQVLIPIANVRNADPVTFIPVLFGQTVAVEGVCSVGRLGGGATNSALQDATHGVAIFSQTAVLGPQNRGNRYAVVGAVAQFNGVVQLTLADSNLVVDLGFVEDPAPAIVSVTDFNTNGLVYQSRVVRIENLSYVSGTWAVGQNVTLQDSSANQVTARIQSGSTAGRPTYPVTLTGIGGQFDPTSPFNSGFQVQPRDQADAPADPPAITSSLTVSATEGASFVYQITATDNPPPTFYDADPLPAGLSIDSATGLISGSPSVSGIFIVEISASNSGGTVTENLQLSIDEAGAYDSWASGFGLDPATTGAPTADPDGDSFSNAQEYAFGTNPTQGNGSLLSSTASGANLVVTWLERSDVTYNVQSTTNLATTAFVNDGTVSVVNGPTEPAPPAGYTRKQITVPATGSKFYRVSAATP